MAITVTTATVVENLHLLTVEELDSLIGAAQYMREVLSSPVVDDGEEEADVAPVPSGGDTTSPGHNGRGSWTELKMIPRPTKGGGRKLYGPYKYRRRWVQRGGKRVCTSTYLGKV